MNTSAFANLAAVAIGLSVLIAPAAARDHSRHGDYWWESGYTSSAYHEYRYPGISWYDDVDCGFGYGYGRHHHAYHRGSYKHGGYRHHRCGKHSRRHHRGEWRYNREHNDWR